MSEILTVPHYQQLADGYCLPACVQMVLSYWGINREQAGIPPIVLVFTGELPYWEKAAAHTVVLLGIVEDSVILNDPGIVQAEVRASVGDFQLAWDEMANLYSLLKRK